MKKSVLSIIFIIILIILAACSDSAFELKRAQEPQWTSTATLEGGLVSAYKHYEWDGTRGFPEYYDWIGSGFFRVRQGLTPAQIPAYYRQYNSYTKECNNWWTSYYQVIGLCNLAIKLDQDGGGNPFQLDKNGDDYQSNYLRQIGEYYFLRGASYYQLARVFMLPYNGNNTNSQKWIPYILQPSQSIEDVQSQKLGTIEEIYTQVIQDLQKAKEYLPEKFNLIGWTTKASGYECGRANKYVASALLGKIYFHMGKYDLAKEEFDYVIGLGDGNFPLSSSPSDPYVNQDLSKVSSEVIWEMNTGDPTLKYEQHNNYWYPAREYGNRARDYSCGSYYVNTKESGQNNTGIQIFGKMNVSFSALSRMGWLNMSDTTLTTAAKSDLRLNGDYTKVFVNYGPYKAKVKKGDPEYITNINDANGNNKDVWPVNIVLDKFFRGPVAPYGKFSKVPYLRTPELLLMRAWIKQNSGDKNGACEDANRVWNRSNPGNPNIFTPSNINTETIFAEYLREMMGEAFVTTFMQGTKMTIPAGEDGNKDEIPYPYPNMYWPIPTDEVSQNPNYQ